MPGAKKTDFEYFLEREMTETGLTEDELFEYRENEFSHIRDGTVSLIPREDLERVLDSTYYRNAYGSALSWGL